MNRAEDEVVPHYPQNKNNAASKLRRDRKHCPLCLAPLVKNVQRTRLSKKCVACQAQCSLTKQCSKCSAKTVWENKLQAACQSCGLHGRKSEVIVTNP
jgi:hypothetical protein